MIASECNPYVKIGGMADVVGALSQTLARMGHEVYLVMPRYRSIDGAKFGIRPFHSPMKVWMGNTEEYCAVHSAEDDAGVRLFFIEYENYFGRDGIYHDSDFNDYSDNARRFSFLSNAALKLCKDKGIKPDVVHVHDWQSSPAAAYLKSWYGNDPVLGNTASILTIHNMAHQGVYDAGDYDYTGLGWSNFTSDKFEDHGRMNFLKGGIAFADMVNTVSRKYAWETSFTEAGCGLQPFLRAKGADYGGILNGADYREWDPAVDKYIPENYDSENVRGKEICKKELQKKFHLERESSVPVFGMVSRFVDQKGVDILAGAIEGIVQTMKAQFVVLGSGDKGLEYYFGDLPGRYPGRIGSFIGYNNELAHQIQAGCDFLLMPSRFEPCGLNQIYSMKYGTLPVVRATGGLDDTVSQYDESQGSGTGFKFLDISSRALYYTVGWAVSTYYDRPAHMKSMIGEAMKKDFCWEKSAKEYLGLYERAVKKKVG